MICSHRNPGRRRPVDRGHCGTVRTWGMQVRWGMNVVLLSACGCAGMREGAHNCPHRWVKCKKRQEVGCGEERVCHGCKNNCMHIYFVWRKPQTNELSSAKQRKSCYWNIQTSVSVGEEVKERIRRVCLCVRNKHEALKEWISQLFTLSTVSLTGAAIPANRNTFSFLKNLKLTSLKKKKKGK